MRFIVIATDSNGVHFGSGPATLPGSLANPNPNAYIFNAGATYWGGLAPTVNTGTAVNPQAWGLETPVAARLAELFPGETFGIIKIAKGGTTIAQDPDRLDWSPNSDGEMFDLAADTIAAARAAYEAATGLPAPGVSAVFVVDGPNAAVDAAKGASYEADLAEYFAAIRDEWMDDPNGQIVYSRMTDDAQAMPHNFAVRVAQWSVDQADPHAESFKTIGYGMQSDGIHYDTLGEISLGRGFVDTWVF